ncbi:MULTISPECIES: DMT family transporter [Pandoraea]|uniref:DMT family transporter n=1 Tax=Pandoraea TaxID=93217 RepID=UPI001F5DBEF7|nr:MULTISPECIES: DMT family transporter [Pandoraea]MCI3208436.1 EamA family transporter [Pandoraea sp. LA3]MDN4586465.1 EamA family transporter [Pandoraea capi]
MGKGIAYGLAAGALWGLVFLAPRQLPGFSPLELSAARYVLYGLVSAVLLAPLWPRLRHTVTGNDWRALFRLSLVGNLVYYLFVAAAVQMAGIAPASLIVGVLPVTVTLVGSRDHGALPLSKLAGPLALIAAGIACINVDVFTHAAASGGDWRLTLIGIVCAVGALVSWTWYAVANARYLAKFGHFTSQEWSLLTGVATGVLAIALAIPAVLLPHPVAAGAARDWQMFLMVNIAVAIGASTIGNAFWNAASRILPLTLSGQMIVFETLFALVYGFVYEQRLPRLLELAAIVLLLLGVSASVRLHAKRPAH